MSNIYTSTDIQRELSSAYGSKGLRWSLRPLEGKEVAEEACSGRDVG